MSRNRTRVLVAALLIAVLSFVGVNITPPKASASVTTITWPSVPLPSATLYAHGNGALTVASDDCYGSYAGTTPSVVTFKPDYSSSNTVLKDTSGWKVTACSYHRTVGNDGTSYVVQQNSSSGDQRLLATRNGTTLWVKPFGRVCGSPIGAMNPTLGFNGQLYVETYNSCTPIVRSLVGINAGTGGTLFITPLPSSTVPSALFDYIMPYDNGIAIANTANHIYYYSYAGVMDSGKTFTPPNASAGAVVVAASTSDSGRTYVITYQYVVTGGVGHDEKRLYYKDPSSSTITEITPPTGALLGNVLAAPNNAAVATWGDSGVAKLGRFDSSGALSYSQVVSADSTAGVVSGSGGIRFAVDNLGNAVVVRTMQRNTSPYDQEVYVDSFDTAGTQTRLFDSEAEFGASGADVFTTNVWFPQAIGDSKIYLVLCHQTGLGGSWPTTCSSSGNPQVVAVTSSSQFDYPRSAAFAAMNAQVQYVALGDSYSAGEGNPSFIAPTDNNGGDGCDRSEAHAYPMLLPADVGFSLRAFVACSGATADEIYTGLNGEPSQLNSLDASTDIVTVTAGGNDAHFADFAYACVVSGCDTSTTVYATSIDYINNYLQDNLELLYGRIRSAAPSATIVVVGYPRVAPPSGVSCSVLTTTDERTAANNLVDGLNTKAHAAVINSGSNFIFVDPTQTGSPFLGHELCTSTPYFFGLNIGEHRSSFHPNADGQTAYEELIANSI